MSISHRMAWTCALLLLGTAASAGPASADDRFQLCCHPCASASCYGDPCAPPCGPIRRLLRRVFHPCCPCPPKTACCPPACVAAPYAPVPMLAPTPPAAGDPAPFISPGPPAGAPRLPDPDPPGASVPPPPAVPSARGSIPVPERPLAPVPAQLLTPPLPLPPVRLDRVASWER